MTQRKDIVTFDVDCIRHQSEGNPSYGYFLLVLNDLARRIGQESIWISEPINQSRIDNLAVDPNGGAASYLVNKFRKHERLIFSRRDQGELRRTLENDCPRSKFRQFAAPDAAMPIASL